MDTLTQIVLGAGVCVAVLGRRLGPRRAAIAGGLLGTLPDLDVLIPAGDPVETFVSHRGFSHSLIIQAMVTPVIGEAMVRLIAACQQQRWQTYAAIYLCLSTHALLDAMTIYGTKLFWPLSLEPFGVGSVFIIDPLYTIPLLLITIIALCSGRWTEGLGKTVIVALVLSTAYQVWCVGALRIVLSKAKNLLRQAGVTQDSLLATPLPFTSLFWRTIVLKNDHYVNLYLPVFGDIQHATLYIHPRHLSLASCLGDNSAFKQLSSFSQGFFRLDQYRDVIQYSDLRMGLTPNYIFSYAIATLSANGTKEMAPRRIFGPRSGPGDFDWLFANLLHHPKMRPTEKPHWIKAADLAHTVGQKYAQLDCRLKPPAGETRKNP